MVGFYNSCVILTLLVTVLILEGDTRKPFLRDGNPALRRDYRPSKWIANSAMDIWYGNKSMIDIMTREFADIMYKLTARPVRSAKINNENLLKYLKYEPERQRKKVEESPDREDRHFGLFQTASRVEINFINENNQTVHTIELKPMMARPPKSPYYKQSMVKLVGR